MSSHLVIRADASSRMGTGHVLRMLALAQAWQRDGGKVVLLTNADCPPELVARCREAGLQVEMVQDAEQDAQELRSLAHSISVAAVVVDGYHFDESYQAALAGVGVTLWTDDYGHCQTWDCDWVLNQNLHGDRAKLAGRAQLLGGVKFALLREDILHQPRPPAREPLRRLLISLGGADPDNATGKVLKAFNEITDESLQLTVLVGAANPHLAELRTLAKQAWHRCVILTGVTNMGALYAKHDGVIGAGGTTCYEWLYYGLPAFVLTLADNQVQVVQELERQHLACCAGWAEKLSVEEMAVALQGWLEKPVRDAQQRVDGQGAWRVAQVLAGRKWAVRLAVETDLSFTLELANEPSVRSAGFSQETITREAHAEWFHRHLTAAGSRIFIIEEPAVGPCGVVRAHQREDGWELGISLLPRARGRGLAQLGLAEVMRQMGGDKMFIARIKPENQSSRQLFERLGFELHEEQPNCLTYHLSTTV